MRISDWSSDVRSSDLLGRRLNRPGSLIVRPSPMPCRQPFDDESNALAVEPDRQTTPCAGWWAGKRSEEHTSELQSLMRISYAVFCLKKKSRNTQISNYISRQIVYTQKHEDA